ncbi:hypothetical protein [Niveibacterium terrae]|uniref:hypothetical protein n=1 Tax=Niveibacterium terrae TaxID=3373598 RepID=UPI003A9216E4
MNDLGETLGHILCEVTRARMAADLEAVRIAKSYAEDPDGLLRHFPVPRMRMPTIEMTLPVIVGQIPEGYVASVSTSMLAASLSENLGEALKAQSIHVSTAEINKIIKADPNLSRGLVSDSLAQKLAEELIDHTRVRTIQAEDKKAGSSERFKKICAIIRAQVGRTLDALPQRAIGIAVDARTQQIKDLGAAGQCLNLKLSVQEDGLDMVFEDPVEGQNTPPALKNLVPE